MGRSGAAPLHGREKPKKHSQEWLCYGPIRNPRGVRLRRRTLQNRGHVADLKLGHYITNQPREAQFWNQAGNVWGALVCGDFAGVKGGKYGALECASLVEGGQEDELFPVEAAEIDGLFEAMDG